MQDYLCKNLRHLRKCNRLTQAEFADKIGIKRSTYANHEKNGISFKYLSLYSKTISNEFGYSIDFLIKNDLQPNQEAEKGFNNAAIIRALENIEQQIKKITEAMRNE